MYLQTALFLVLAVSGLSNAAPAEHEKRPHPPVPDWAVCGSKIQHSNEEGVKSPHGVPQNTPSPYSIALSERTVSAGRSVQVTISGQNQEAIRGLTLTAKCGDKIVGSFSSDSIKVDLRNCEGVENSGVLYIDMERRDVREAVLTWKAPSEACQDVEFHAVIMKDRQTTWVQTATLPTTFGLSNVAHTKHAKRPHPPVPDWAVCGSKIQHGNEEGVKSPHGVPQNTPSPYSIALSERTVSAGGSVQVTISGQNQEAIRGLTLTAKCGEEIVGSFSSDSIKVDLRNCGGVENSGVLYIDMERRDVREAALTWKAPSEACQDVKFHALIMKDGQTAWVQTSTLPLTVSAASASL